jgi:hypothetical protein
MCATRARPARFATWASPWTWRRGTSTRAPTRWPSSTSPASGEQGRGPGWLRGCSRQQRRCWATRTCVSREREPPSVPPSRVWLTAFVRGSLPLRDCVMEDTPMLEVLRRASERVFVPLTVGGGIKALTDSSGRTFSAVEVAAEYFRWGEGKGKERGRRGPPAQRAPAPVPARQPATSTRPRPCACAAHRPTAAPALTLVPRPAARAPTRCLSAATQWTRRRCAAMRGGGGGSAPQPKPAPPRLTPRAPSPAFTPPAPPRSPTTRATAWRTAAAPSNRSAPCTASRWAARTSGRARLCGLAD